MDNEFIIRIVLRARDEMAATLSKANAQIAGFGKELVKPTSKCLTLIVLLIIFVAILIN